MACSRRLIAAGLMALLVTALLAIAGPGQARASSDLGSVVPGLSGASGAVSTMGAAVAATVSGVISRQADAMTQAASAAGAAAAGAVRMTETAAPVTAASPAPAPVPGPTAMTPPDAVTGSGAGTTPAAEAGAPSVTASLASGSAPIADRTAAAPPGADNGPSASGLVRPVVRTIAGPVSSISSALSSAGQFGRTGGLVRRGGSVERHRRARSGRAVATGAERETAPIASLPAELALAPTASLAASAASAAAPSAAPGRDRGGRRGRPRARGDRTAARRPLPAASQPTVPGAPPLPTAPSPAPSSAAPSSGGGAAGAGPSGLLDVLALLLPVLLWARLATRPSIWRARVFALRLERPG